MAITVNFVDPVLGNNANPGTLAQPWLTLQWAFDNCIRNAADGNQICLKSSGPHVNAAALDLTIFIAGGALATNAPLIVRGYTAAADDGGVGEIDCNGVTMWASNYSYLVLADLEIHSFGDNNGIVLEDHCTVYRCEIHKGASAPSGKRLLTSDDNIYVINCYVHDVGTGANATGIYTDGMARVWGNYIVTGAVGAAGLAARIGTYGVALNNVLVCADAGSTGILGGGQHAVYASNAVYNSAAGTASGISFIVETGLGSIAMNNIIEGWSGVGGEGIANSNAAIIGYNAFYNNTAQYTISDMTFIDLTANDVDLTPLGASPFTNAAAGDFSLTAGAKALLRGVGWPAAYLGAHANTDGHITIGPIQYGEAEGGGGAVSISPYRGNL